MNNKIFVGSVFVLGVALFLLTKNQNSSEVKSLVAPQTSENIFIRPHSPSFGNVMGKVTVIEWFDPECETCRVIHPTMKKIISEYKDRVHFVFRYMPYHTNSTYAASVLEEAKEAGKFEEALDILFVKQPEWGNHQNPQPQLIPEYLSILGLSKEQLKLETVIQKHGEKIKLDQADGEKAGVQGTPTFFINGQLLHELGEESLRAAIDAGLKN